MMGKGQFKRTKGNEDLCRRWGLDDRFLGCLFCMQAPKENGVGRGNGYLYLGLSHLYREGVLSLFSLDSLVSIFAGLLAFVCRVFCFDHLM
jgi:hypothetical protein